MTRRDGHRVGVEDKFSAVGHSVASGAVRGVVELVGSGSAA
jgi:hypothetical protein